jgi:hypothetical protein
MVAPSCSTIQKGRRQFRRPTRPEKNLVGSSASAALRNALEPCRGFDVASCGATLQVPPGAAFTIAAAPSAYLLALYCRHQEIERIITAPAHDFWLDNQHL